MKIYFGINVIAEGNLKDLIHENLFTSILKLLIYENKLRKEDED